MSFLSSLFPEEIAHQICRYSAWSMIDLFCCQWALLFMNPSRYMKRPCGQIKWFSRSFPRVGEKEHGFYAQWSFSCRQGIESLRVESIIMSSHLLLPCFQHILEEVQDYHQSTYYCDRHSIELSAFTCSQLRLSDLVDFISFLYYYYPPSHILDNCFTTSDDYPTVLLWRTDWVGHSTPTSLELFFSHLLRDFFQQPEWFRRLVVSPHCQTCFQINPILRQCSFFSKKDV